MNRDLLGILVVTKSLINSAGWRILCDWSLPETMAEQVKWSVTFNDAKMDNREEPIKCFGRIDKVIGVLASLGVLKSLADANRNKIMTLTPSDCEIEEPFYTVRASVERRLRVQ